MEQIREAAFAFYEVGSVELKQSATTIFNSMDADGDGKISISEFTNFLRTNNYHYRQELFQEIDRDGNGSLDFGEVVVFFYITKTRKTWCDGCKTSLLGIYFICSDCFYKTQGGYDLCCACYRSRRYESGHGPFLDNHAMLNEVRWSAVRQRQAQPPPPPPQQQQRQPQAQPPPPTPQQQIQVTNRNINRGDGGRHEVLNRRLVTFTNEMNAATAFANLVNAGCSIM